MSVCSLENTERFPVGMRFADFGANGEAVELGIMGGTFDPPHLGHLRCAEIARSACSLDGVLFLPTADPSLKQGKTVATVEDRLSMCRLAVADNSAFDVGTLEIDRGGITYTIDTARELRELFPSNVQLRFIIGGDSLDTLPGWKNAEELTQLIGFICVARPGVEGVQQKLQRARDMGFNIEYVEALPLNVSSSYVRDSIAKGESVRYLLPLSVISYIDGKGLYR